MVSQGENTSHRTSKDHGELVTDCQTFQVLSPDPPRKKIAAFTSGDNVFPFLFFLEQV